jgi:hypothetical protein
VSDPLQEYARQHQRDERCMRALLAVVAAALAVAMWWAWQ